MTENELLRRCTTAGLPEDWANHVLSKAKRLGLVDELYVDTLIADAIIVRATRQLSSATKELIVLRKNYSSEIARTVAKVIEPQVAEVARRATQDVLASPARMVRQTLIVGMFVFVAGSISHAAGAYSAGSGPDAVSTFFWFLNQGLSLAIGSLIYFFRAPLRDAWAKVKQIM